MHVINWTELNWVDPSLALPPTHLCLYGVYTRHDDFQLVEDRVHIHFSPYLLLAGCQIRIQD